MESWWFTQTLGHSGSVWSKARRVECGAWLGTARAGSRRPLRAPSRDTTEWGGACYVGAACLAECWVWVWEPDSAQLAFSFPLSSLGSSFRFSATSFICCRENRGH